MCGPDHFVRWPYPAPEQGRRMITRSPVVIYNHTHHESQRGSTPTKSLHISASARCPLNRSDENNSPARLNSSVTFSRVASRSMRRRGAAQTAATAGSASGITTPCCCHSDVRLTGHCVGASLAKAVSRDMARRYFFRYPPINSSSVNSRSRGTPDVTTGTALSYNRSAKTTRRSATF